MGAEGGIGGGELRGDLIVHGVEVEFAPAGIDVEAGPEGEFGRLLLTPESPRDDTVEAQTLALDPVAEQAGLLLAERGEAVVILAGTRLAVAEEVDECHENNEGSRD